MLVRYNHNTPSAHVLVRGLVKRGGEIGGGLVLHWHVVGMSLTSQGSGENKQAPVCALSSGFVCKVPAESWTPAGGQGNKTAAC